MKPQLLLLEDVDGLGRSGDLVVAKPGYVRNYLLPKGKAVVASAGTLRLQAKLQEQRLLQAAADKEESLRLAEMLRSIVLDFQVRVDSENNMYGSVTVNDMISAAEQQGVVLTRKNFPRSHSGIKNLGRHVVGLKLKEGVTADLHLEVRADHEIIEQKGLQSAEEQEG
ncbi:50S ribosomal protein L9 [Chlamydia trachomatis]|uniref:50S ribosomal protein L9 n=1 Tax=Chlamydia trachomatis TaxID=813 RepID=UPI0001B5A4A2|nr:50S ribosomal protein L9 [Chlamydia trachomatis]ADH17608.1 50S ribosomal protein L9 [Chlamydia trachomatis E/150]ADH21300.1 50S ribosomal protein L9 [Chlamydia trachomatis E/11023]AGT64769.1 50S ribosomal protein L9 [Chlamydia trachomatis]AGT65699.1 50S ribosomal protein L9 [Chlamydia trachomatis]AGT66625.1 50S ribosomal protein L9 [Chlamydia trachomatis]